MNNINRSESDKYNRLRRLESLGRLLSRLACQLFAEDDYHWTRNAARARRIWTRLWLVLWELPPCLQTGLCGVLAQRALPAFEQRHPTLNSMRGMLSPEWIREAMGRSVGSEKAHWEELGYELNALRQALDDQAPKGGDEFIYSAAVELWKAFDPDAAPATLTYHCIHSAFLAVKADQYDAWEILDPEAAQYVRDLHARVEREGSVILPKVNTKFRIPEADPVAQERWFAAWGNAMSWLRAVHLENYDELKDRAGLAKAALRSRTVTMKLV